MSSPAVCCLMRWSLLNDVNPILILLCHVDTEAVGAFLQQTSVCCEGFRSLRLPTPKMCSTDFMRMKGGYFLLSNAAVPDCCVRLSNSGTIGAMHVSAETGQF